MPLPPNESWATRLGTLPDPSDADHNAIAFLYSARGPPASVPKAPSDIVVAAITRTDEWVQKNAGRAPPTPASFRAVVSFSRDEFLDALNPLDRFNAAPEGLQRPAGCDADGVGRDGECHSRN